MLDIFSMISSVDVSYKTVERLHSDEEVVLAIHNLHTLILKKNDVSGSKTTGDGTGYLRTGQRRIPEMERKMIRTKFRRYIRRDFLHTHFP